MNARVFLLLSISVLLPACALLPKEESTESEAARLVAQDFVNVLQQVEGLRPEATVLDFRPSANAIDGFAGTLEATLQRAGYAIREGGTGISPNPVSYTIVRKMDSETGQMLTYTLSVGGVSMRRSYKPTENGLVAPLATMQVKGIDASGLHLNDSIFKSEQPIEPGKGELMVKNLQNEPTGSSTQSPDEQPVEVAVKTPILSSDQALPVVVSATERPQAEPVTRLSESSTMQATVQAPVAANAALAPTRIVAADQTSQTNPLASNSLIDIAAPSIAGTSRPLGVFDGLAALSQKPTRNMKDIGKSNFEAVLTDFNLVKEAVLTFGDDSLRLGDVNKTRVQQFVELFAEESDVFSIIGCSHGPTKREIGQQGLALGRAQRVRDELLFSGVPEERILDEGCWANEAFDERFPRRGVVLSLLRPTV